MSTTLAGVIQDLVNANAFFETSRNGGGPGPGLSSAITSLINGFTCTGPGLVNGIYVCSGATNLPTFNYLSVYPANGDGSMSGPIGTMQAAAAAVAKANLPAMILNLQVPSYTSLMAVASKLQALDPVLSPLGNAIVQLVMYTNYNQWLGGPVTPVGQYVAPPPGPIDPIVSFLSSFYPGVPTAPVNPLSPPVIPPSVFLQDMRTLQGIAAPMLTHPAPPKPKPVPPPADNTSLYMGGAVLGIGAVSAIAFLMRR